MTDDDTHRQWRLYAIVAEPMITPRQAFYRAVAEGLVADVRAAAIRHGLLKDAGEQR